MKRKAITIYYDSDTGEIRGAKSTAHFDKESTLMKLDVLLDALNFLGFVYEEMSKAFFAPGGELEREAAELNKREGRVPHPEGH